MTNKTHSILGKSEDENKTENYISHKISWNKLGIPHPATLLIFRLREGSSEWTSANQRKRMNRVEKHFHWMQDVYLSRLDSFPSTTIHENRFVEW